LLSGGRRHLDLGKRVARELIAMRGKPDIIEPILERVRIERLKAVNDGVTVAPVST
jgi:hypothetical protein